MSVFTNKVLLEHSRAHSFVLVSLAAFCTTMVELNDCDKRPYGLNGLKYFYLALYSRSTLSTTFLLYGKHVVNAYCLSYFKYKSEFRENSDLTSVQ